MYSILQITVNGEPLFANIGTVSLYKDNHLKLIEKKRMYQEFRKCEMGFGIKNC